MQPMEFNDDRTQCRRTGYGHYWRSIDPETGLVLLDEGLYFHFRKGRERILTSVRARMWYGYRTLITVESTDPIRGAEDLLSLSYAAISKLEYSSEYRTWSSTKKVKEALVDADKWMGSYKPGRKVQNDND